MKPHKRSIREVFGSDVSYRVPRYQRSYVWEREKHWEPLWLDIENLLDAYNAGAQKRHFMGAIVLQYDDSAPGGVAHWNVIDGQQRLTTLQLVLAACGTAAGHAGAEVPAKLFRRLVENDRDLASDEERFKVRPSDLDVGAFRLCMQDGGPDAQTPDDPSNTIQEAFAFFLDAIQAWALTGGPDPEDLNKRYRVLFGVVGDLLQMVSINLEDDDDAQIIFETLNARGTPLLQIELVKNAILSRINAQGDDADAVHDSVWYPEFSLAYWRQEERQGRLIRPRSEIFLGHWLTMRLAEPLGSTELFSKFRNRVLDDSPQPNGKALVTELCRDAAVMRGFDSADPSSPAGRFFRVMAALDTTTFHPLALKLFVTPRLDPERRNRALAAIESFAVRRMLRGLTPKAYNRLAVETLKAAVGREADLDTVIVDALCASAADTARWPTDDGMAEHLARQGLYNWVGQAKIRLILGEIELARRESAKVEDIFALPRKLSIEHLMPREWRKYWPLPRGADEGAEERRDSLLNVIGNLTLITGQLNSSLSNQPWEKKRKRLTKNSVLLINQDLGAEEVWDESRIIERGAALTTELTERWPGPTCFKPDYDPSEGHPPSSETGREKSSMDLDDVEAVYREGSGLMRQLLEELAASGERRRTFESVEDSLGWTRGRLASVLGGYANYAKGRVNGRRPHRVAQDEAGQWWIWIDQDRAELIKRIASGDSGS